jgi:hypothetical protein
MQRRKCNTTRLDRNLQQIAWRVELRFQQADYVYTVNRVYPQQTLGQVRLDGSKPPSQRLLVPVC